MLALSFLVVVGVVLIAEGFDQHVPKGYVYFAMAFSVGVEMLNLTMRKRSARKLKLRSAYGRPAGQLDALPAPTAVATAPAPAPRPQRTGNRSPRR